MALNKFFKIFGILLLSVVIYGYFKTSNQPETNSSKPSPRSQQDMDSTSDTKIAQAREEKSHQQNMNVQGSRSLATKENVTDDSELGPGLKKLQEESQKKWRLKKDSLSGRLKTLIAGKIKITGSTIEERAQIFIDTYAGEIFNTQGTSLRLKSKTLTAESILRYEQTYRDKTIYGASLTLIFENDSLVRVQNDLISDPKLADSSGRVLGNEDLEKWLQGVTIASEDDIQKVGTSYITAIEDVYLTSAQGLVDGASINLDRLNGGALKDKYQLIVDLTGPRVIRSIPLHKN